MQGSRASPPGCIAAMLVVIAMEAEVPRRYIQGTCRPRIELSGADRRTGGSGARLVTIL